jgi:MFS family permease
LIGEVVPAERRGTAVGVVQLCGDAGGLLGPLVGTTFLRADIGRPYLASGALLVAAFPLAIWLANRERSRSLLPQAIAEAPGRD